MSEIRFHTQFSQLLELTGTSKQDLSRKLEMSYTSINAYSKGTTAPLVTFVEKLVDHFPNLDSNFLFRDGFSPFLEDYSEGERGAKMPREATVVRTYLDIISSLKAQISSQEELISILQEQQSPYDKK